MSPREKIDADIRSLRMSQTEYAEVAGVAQSRLNDVIRGKELTLRNALPIIDYMKGRLGPGATLDWLYDETKSYPPPVQAAGAVVLTAEERKLLDIARELGDGGDWYAVAKRRLLGLPDLPTASSGHEGPGPNAAPGPRGQGGR